MTEKVILKKNTYLLFNGNAEEAFNFYKSVFGGEFTSLQRFKDVPEQDQKRGGFNKNESEKIIHIALPIGEKDILMASDFPESIDKTSVGNNFSISIETNSKEKAEEILKGLSDGAKIQMPLVETFWGDYYEKLKDKFGVGWMVNYTYPKE
jgi:PhnB protein